MVINRACSSLAQHYPQLARDLFNLAFMSCWTELDDRVRKDLVTALERALTVPDSPELALAVLNLAEFMEHCEKGSLPIPIKLLGDTAITCRAYAKALYYKVLIAFKHTIYSFNTFILYILYHSFLCI